MLTRRTTLGATAALVGAGVLGTAGAAGARYPVPLIGPATADALHLMTYNVRAPQPTTRPGDPDHWEGRSPLVTRLLATEEPTLLAVQEACDDHLDAFAEALPHHRSLGYGIGEPTLAGYGALLYDARRLEPVTWGREALSETPAVVDSTGWGNDFPRSLTWARLRDTRTGRVLTVVATHFDHESEYARVRSAQQVAARAATADGPVVVLGDFNAAAGASVPCSVLTGDGALRDTWATAARRAGPAWGTFPDYGAAVPGGRRIDWVLAGPGVAVERAAINATTFRTDAGDRWPSDHTPVQALVRLV